MYHWNGLPGKSGNLPQNAKSPKLAIAPHAETEDNSRWKFAA
jgi:hypothetical protein